MSDKDESHVALTNDAWGFESNCFVSPITLLASAIPSYHDTATATVVAEFSLDERFSGALRYVHGGIALAILDEAMAWATISIWPNDSP